MLFFLRSEGSAGGGPAAAHFSCLAKKSKQKKATATAQPFGFPLESPKKWERQSRFAPTVFLIHFFGDSSGWSEADFVTGSPSALRFLLLACGIGVFDRYRFYASS
ncbi:hypothetical protein ACIPEN_20170 [Herbaspirillum chlorophenolicum]|uniref:Secreted protein n=1 Tax=Herbaspirillum chlorophenolicum TaxID=211589 RepID=A0ABW8F4F7_9BURK